MNIKKKLSSIMAICMVISLFSIPTLAASSSHKYGPAPEYQNMQGLPKNVKYNSAGVPILGTNIRIKAPSRYKDITGEYAINGHTIPLYNYPVNSIWKGSEECVGFARYVYNYIWKNKTGQTFFASTSDEYIAKSTLTSLKNGTRITGFNDGNQMHTMILVSTTVYDDGVVVYHANYSDTHNEVTLTKFTYKEFSELFDSIEGVKPPKK